MVGAEALADESELEEALYEGCLADILLGLLFEMRVVGNGNVPSSVVAPV